MYLKYLGIKDNNKPKDIVVYYNGYVVHDWIYDVMNQESLSLEQKVIQDLLSIIHCFSSRLYGLRKYKKKIKEAITLKETL